jgi:hypothetical protein
MMIKHTITKGYWKKIGNVGESGTAWLKSANGFTPVLIFCHTDSIQTYDPDDDPDLGIFDDNIPLAEAVDLDIDAGYIYKIFKELTPILEAENANDVWYVTLASGITGATCEIIADFL